MKDLSKAIKSLSDKQKDKVFKNGEIFMNLEIIYPASSNVIDYDKAVLQFHNSYKIQYPYQLLGILVLEIIMSSFLFVLLNNN